MTVAIASARHLDSAELVRLISGPHGVIVRDRYHRLTRYHSCFLGSDLVDVLVRIFGWPRAHCVRIGQRLLAQEFIDHVAGEHDFKDEPLFYRFAERLGTPETMSIDLSYGVLVAMVREMRTAHGVRVSDHRRLLVTYPDCFVSSQAVDWLCSKAQMNRVEAVQTGQALLQANLIRHVFDELHFVDAAHFYRFM